MPNNKSGRKRLRTSQAACELNVAVRTRVKTARRSLNETLASGDAEASVAAYKSYCSILDKAAKRGTIKSNTAARRKGRAADKIRAQSAG